MLKLVLVSARTIVSRTFEETDNEIIREIGGDAEMMRQVLIIENNDKVIFEIKRGVGDGKKYKTAEIREIIENKNEIRRLTAREKKALEKVVYSC